VLSAACIARPHGWQVDLEVGVASSGVMSKLSFMNIRQFICNLMWRQYDANTGMAIGTSISPYG